MYVVGLTGGIGSGKTLVSNLFADLGVDIVDADVISREVTLKGSPCLQKIRERFGPEILDSDGFLNRAKLRKIIFSDKQEKFWLESVMHPEINKITVEQLHRTSSPYVVYVSPLLIEANLLKFVNSVLVVDTDEEKQVSRTATRDNVEEDHVQRIMATQLDREKRKSLAQEVIDNSKDIEHTKQQVNRLHALYMSRVEK